MPPVEIIWCLLLAAAIFLVATTSLLRVSCELANYAGHWSPSYGQIQVPKYRTCFTIVLAAGIVLSLAATFGNSLFPTSWFSSYLGERPWHIITSIAQWLIFATFIGLGLSDEQQAPTRLV